MNSSRASDSGASSAEDYDIDALTVFPPITDLPLDKAWHEMSCVSNINSSKKTIHCHLLFISDIIEIIKGCK